MAFLDLREFGSSVIDQAEVVALVGRTVFLRDGREVGVDAETADALRAAIRPSRARKRGKQVWEGAGRPANPAATGAGPNSPLDL